jgi:beta-1,4-N-acetylglucosaminyltransferase
MKIFITVGTTKFDSLIEYLDNNLNKEDDILFQIAEGKYQPKNFKFINYTTEINNLYKEYDYIITHAGSSSIYKLLKLRKKMIIVPNLERIDKHQLDIAHFVDTQNYAVCCQDFEKIIPTLKKLPSSTFLFYEKSTFILDKEICKVLNNVKL